MSRRASFRGKSVESTAKKGTANALPTGIAEARPYTRREGVLDAPRAAPVTSPRVIPNGNEAVDHAGKPLFSLPPPECRVPSTSVFPNERVERTCVCRAGRRIDSNAAGKMSRLFGDIGFPCAAFPSGCKK